MGWDAYAAVSSSAGGFLPARALPRRRRARGRSTSRAMRLRCPPAGRSTGWPSTRGCACGSTGARSTWGRRARSQRCPSDAIGRRRAILVEPGARERPQARASAVARPRSPAPTSTPASASTPAPRPPRGRWRPGANPRPTGAIGVYIGGLNRACSQPNLTAAWVGEQVAEGWHLIPTYVGLQSPTSVCGTCAELSTSLTTAAAQGVAAGPGRGRRRAGDRHGPRQPDLLRHGGLHADRERDAGDADLPRGLDRRAARARLQLRRLQLQRLGHRRPRPRSGQPRVPAARRPLVRQLERRRQRARPLRPLDRLAHAPAHPPVPRRPQRDLGRDDDQHRQQLRRRDDRRLGLGAAPRCRR